MKKTKAQEKHIGTAAENGTETTEKDAITNALSADVPTANTAKILTERAGRNTTAAANARKTAADRQKKRRNAMI